MKALAICRRLGLLIEAGALRGTVHSVFDHAVNLAFEDRLGLIGLIASERTLTPYAASVRAGAPFPGLGIQAGMTAALADGAAVFPEADIRLDLSGAERVDLSVDSIQPQGSVPPPRSRLPALLSVLCEGDAAQGLAPLVTQAPDNVYTRFLRSRFDRLTEAVAAGDADGAAEAAERVAGCGAGLTPSSDDLLAGYLLTLRVLANVGLARDARAFLPDMARRAAGKTNRISATFLLHSGEGLASEAMLALLSTILSDADDTAVGRSAGRVASIGSTSGGDMLAGMALAILHHDGGTYRGSTGNPEKRLL